MSDSIPLLEQFVNYLHYERHFSPYTARCYGADLRQFVEYLTEQILRQVPAPAAQESVSF